MSAQKFDLNALKSLAYLFRREILETLETAGSGHPGGSLSAVEIFISLYGFVMNHRSSEPLWDGRDRLVVSKGHITPAVYVTLANFGYIPKDELKTFRKFGSRLQGHVTKKTPGIEFNTGSLGHGLSFANGVAMAAKLKGKDFKAYCLMGDGEIQEGSVWEAAMSASHFKLDNVCAIVDYNKVQENGLVNDIKNLEPLADRWRSFGWHTIEVDGNDFTQLAKAFEEFKNTKGKPTAIIAHTLKGKGVPFMELKSAWHGKAPNKAQLAEALNCLY